MLNRIGAVDGMLYGFLAEEIEKHHIGDVTVLDKVAIATLCFFMIIIGMFPSVMVPMVESGVENILRLLGGA